MDWTYIEVRLENLVMTGPCLSSNEERVVLYENTRESRDSAGLVMRADDRISQRKSSMLIDCRRRNVCCVGGRGQWCIELTDSLVKMTIRWRTE